MEVLTLKSTVDLTFYINGGTQENRSVYLDIINTSYAGKGNEMGANFEYYFLNNEGTKVVIQSDPFILNETEMNAMYDAIKAGIPADATYSAIQYYLNSTAGKAEFQQKYVDLNPSFTIAQIEVVNPPEGL